MVRPRRIVDPKEVNFGDDCLVNDNQPGRGTERVGSVLAGVSQRNLSRSGVKSDMADSTDNLATNPHFCLLRDA